MGVPLTQMLSVGAYITKERLRGNGRFPLVLMLEPLFRCNLSCSGCGKIDYPEEVLRRRLGVSECLDAARECGAPIVSIPGGEPLMHPEIGGIVEGLTEMKRFVYLCTNAVLLKKKLGLFRPSQYLTFSVHLDGFKERHDSIVGANGVFDKAVEAIRLAKERGFRVTTNTTLFEDAQPRETARFFDFVTGLGVEGMTISPGFVYEKARGKASLSRNSVHEIFRALFQLGRGRGWRFNHSSLYLDFLAGNRVYRCTPWGNPTRNIFGWQRPCYLVAGGYARSYGELMEETDWEGWGYGVNPRCSGCMVHCGYEPTAVMDSIRNPLKAMLVNVRGVNTKEMGAPPEARDKTAFFNR